MKWLGALLLAWALAAGAHAQQVNIPPPPFSGPWTAFTPSVVLTGGTGTSVSSQAGSWIQVGKILFFRAIFAVNFSTAPTAVTLTLPNSGLSAASGAQTCIAENISTANIGTAVVSQAGTTAVFNSATGGQLETATGNFLIANCVIEVQ